MRAALLALALLTPAGAGVAPVGAAPPLAATMMRFTTDKENLKIANRSLEFVKIIREDLRRNNDDYAAGGGSRRPQRPTQTRSPPPPPAPPPAPPGPRAPPALRAPPGRGALTPSPPSRIPLAHNPMKRLSPKRDLPKFPIDTRRNLNISKYDTTARLNAQNVTIFRSYSHPMRHNKQARVGKVKRLIDKGKRLREMGRLPAASAPPATVAAQANMAKSAIRADVANVETGKNYANGENDTIGANGPNTVEEALATPAAAASSPAGPGRPRPAPGEPGRGAWAALRQHAARGSPSPDQLDMAPARGAQIHVIRYKGRLCQRSVLSIEGPVYDGQGSSVVPAYRPEFGRGRQFSNTRAPDIVLPRCCNCCKKSVLGCQ